MILANDLPLSLYVHIPWCVRKCPYCDFNSHEVRGELPEQAYIDALIDDLDQDLVQVRDRTVCSIFFGGGTPSLLQPAAFTRFMQALARRVTLALDVEVTLEANPESSNATKFEAYRVAGCNRLSIGVQSFDDDQLQVLKRAHNAGQAHGAITAARAAGFDNVNIDLMYGLPGQTIPGALRDIDLAIGSGATHISCYQLTIEPHTWFHRFPPELPDDDTIWEMQTGIVGKLSDAGFSQYEVSAYAKSGGECRHNLNYWRFGDYLGIGAGAHGKLTTDAGITRYWKIRDPRSYLAVPEGASRRGGEHRPDDETVLLEFMMNALRLRERISIEFFTARTGLARVMVSENLARARERGLVHWDGESFGATPLGHRFLNDLLVMISEQAVERPVAAADRPTFRAALDHPRGGQL